MIIQDTAPNRREFIITLGKHAFTIAVLEQTAEYSSKHKNEFVLYFKKYGAISERTTWFPLFTTQQLSTDPHKHIRIHADSFKDATKIAKRIVFKKLYKIALGILWNLKYEPVELYMDFGIGTTDLFMPTREYKSLTGLCDQINSEKGLYKYLRKQHIKEFSASEYAKHMIVMGGGATLNGGEE